MEKCCVVLNGCRSASGVDFWQIFGERIEYNGSDGGQGAN